MSTIIEGNSKQTVVRTPLNSAPICKIYFKNVNNSFVYILLIRKIEEVVVAALPNDRDAHP